MFHSSVSSRRKTLPSVVWKRKRKQDTLLYHVYLAFVSSLLFQQSAECRMSIKGGYFSSLLSFFSTRISTTAYSIHTHILHPYRSYTKSPYTHKFCSQRSLTAHPGTVSPYTSIYRQHYTKPSRKASIHKSFASSASSTHLSISKTRFPTSNCHPSCLLSVPVLPGSSMQVEITAEILGISLQAASSQLLRTHLPAGPLTTALINSVSKGFKTLI